MTQATSRRGIGTFALSSLLVGLGSVGGALPADAADDTGSDVRNVILLIGDGMGRTHVTAGRQRYFGANGRLTMETAPVVGQVSTYAVEPQSALPALVTDSASSATAWSSGVKTYNAAIGVDAFGKKVPTIMEQAKAAGMKTGNVSTAEITDATPAGMFSHALLRGCQGPKYSDASCKPKATTAVIPRCSCRSPSRSRVTALPTSCSAGAWPASSPTTRRR